MSLEIGLAGDRPGALLRTAPIVSFDDDENGGYYWYLWPLFDRLAHETGQCIDLYGVAKFHGHALHLLRQTVLDARQLVAAQPERWSVHVGTQIMPNAPQSSPAREIFKGVERSTFLALLDSLLATVDQAIEAGLPIVCFGD